jgi:hypothetical protein
MNKRLLKTILLVFVSPLIIAAIAGAAYLGIQLMRGIELRAATEGLRSLIDSIIPYISYITVIPALIVLLVIGVKNRNRIKLK